MGAEDQAQDQARGGEYLWPARVYYEDTDAGRVVYHAAYLRFFERARTEALRAVGIDQTRLLEEEGILFMVRRVEIDWLAPGRLDDLLEISARLERMGGASFELAQEARREGKVLARARVVCVCVGPQGGAMRTPHLLRERIGAAFGAGAGAFA